MATLVTNIRVFLAIAEAAAAESKRLSDEATTPRPDGGVVVRHDPERKSYKQCLIAIAFAGIYLEAFLGLVGVKQFGSAWYAKHDRKKYEDKLKVLGVADPQLLADCKRFRETRNDLTHEKVVDLDSPEAANAPWIEGQVEAAFAIEFVKSVTQVLRR